MTIREIVIKRNDRREPVRIAPLSRSTGEKLNNMTGATAVFSMTDLSTGDLKINRQPCTVSVSGSGVLQYVQYAWADGDTDTVGDYGAEFEVTDPSGRKLTLPNQRGCHYLSIRIIADLDAT